MEGGNFVYCCSHWLLWFCVGPLFCNLVLVALSSLTIVLERERERELAVFLCVLIIYFISPVTI